MDTAALVNALPDGIRVGAYYIRLEKWTSAQALGAVRYGEFSSVEQRISISTTLPEGAKAADTLIHELGHAIYYAFYIEDEDKEERTVATMARAWTQIYRDNPWLLDWIAQAVTSA